jgi:transcriptional regulator with XRE-family HTH domain
MTDEQALALRAKMLGAMLRMARQSAGRSLKEAAAYLGVTASTLSSYETGRKSISLPELELLAFHLGVPLRRFWSLVAPASTQAPVNPGAIRPIRQRMIAALLKTHRQDAQLSIKQVAEVAGMSAARLSGYERGDRPVPIPHLESLVAAMGRSIEEYIDTRGPFGEWDSTQRALEILSGLPADLRDFLVNPANRPYLRLAKQLSDLSVDKLRSVAQGMLDITL